MSRHTFSPNQSVPNLRLRVAAIFALAVSVAACGPSSSKDPELDTTRQAAVDGSTADGVWYLNANAGMAPGRTDVVGARLTLSISPWDTYIEFDGTREIVDNIAWSPATRELEFRRIGSGFCQWYRGRVAEGVFVGRFSHGTSPDRPALSAYAYHFTGWNDTYLSDWSKTYFGHSDLPRTYSIEINQLDRATVRLDRAASGKLEGYMKVTSRIGAGASGEELEYPIDVTHWDGRTVSWTRDLGDPCIEKYAGTLSGRLISGTLSECGTPAGTFSGARSQVLGFGLEPRSADARDAWQIRTRRQIELLTRGGATVDEWHATLADPAPPMPQSLLYAARNDNPRLDLYPQNYQTQEIWIRATTSSPYGTGSTATRLTHGYLLLPDGATSATTAQYPAVIAAHGHAEAAHNGRHPGAWYWYGESFVRRGYVVILLDVVHRPVEDAAGLYPVAEGLVIGSVKFDGFASSDWEQDGERSWDISRAVDFLLTRVVKADQRPVVDKSKVGIVGLSMGGEVATLGAALDPRIQFIVAAGYSPDYEVFPYRGSPHQCWQWAHGDIREYVDHADHLALLAPRQTFVLTGINDGTFSVALTPYAADKQVVRRAWTAYGSDATLRHFLHTGAHDYTDGDVFLEAPAVSYWDWGRGASDVHRSLDRFVRLAAPPASTEPHTAWQTSTSTVNTGQTLHEMLRDILYP